MSVRALDANSDWSFGKGINSYKFEVEELKQNISSRILMWVGDCFFAPNEGVDYNNYFDIGTKVFLDTNFKRVTLQTAGVLVIKEYSSTVTDRDISVFMKLNTIYGEIEISEVLGNDGSE